MLGERRDRMEPQRAQVLRKLGGGSEENQESGSGRKIRLVLGYDETYQVV